jgi:hypothetical protein
MALVDQAQSPFFFAEARDRVLIWSDAVAVRLRGVRRLRQRVAERRVERKHDDQEPAQTASAGMIHAACGNSGKLRAVRGAA